MTPRTGRVLLFLILTLAFVSPALAFRGGRGGGGGGGARGGGGMPRGGGGGGGMPRGGAGGGFSHSPSVSSPRPAQRPSHTGGAGGARPGGPSVGSRPGAGNAAGV